MRFVPAGVAIAALALPAGATAARPVPAAVERAIAAKTPRAAYVPTRLAIGYRYVRWRQSAGVVRTWFRNRGGREIVFVAAPFRGECRRGMEKSFQLAGNKVYWGHTANEQQAWRCIRGVRLVAATPQSPRQFADVGLGRIVASGKRI